MYAIDRTYQLSSTDSLLGRVLYGMIINVPRYDAGICIMVIGLLVGPIQGFSVELGAEVAFPFLSGEFIGLFVKNVQKTYRVHYFKCLEIYFQLSQWDILVLSLSVSFIRLDV